jgi:putative nucleotidyltransferase with HDIG domain
MRKIVEHLWPELQWIEDMRLRSCVTKTWMTALERGPLKVDDLHRIPFTLLIPNCRTNFMDHKRCVVHIARAGAEAMQQYLGQSLTIDMDTVIAGAILADVGKLLEYEIGPDGVVRQQGAGAVLRHPFTGVALAMECGVPDRICHVIAAHAAEGGFVKRSTEAWIVHHADFMAFDPYKSAEPLR